jgi:hypothetical protein
MKFAYTVIVDTDTKEHADLVIEARLGYDEELDDEQGATFDYKVWKE